MKKKIGLILLVIGLILTGTSVYFLFINKNDDKKMSANENKNTAKGDNKKGNSKIVVIKNKDSFIKQVEEQYGFFMYELSAEKISDMNTLSDAAKLCIGTQRLTPAEEVDDNSSYKHSYSYSAVTNNLKRMFGKDITLAKSSATSHPDLIPFGAGEFTTMGCFARGYFNYESKTNNYVQEFSASGYHEGYDFGLYRDYVKAEQEGNKVHLYVKLLFLEGYPLESGGYQYDLYNSLGTNHAPIKSQKITLDECEQSETDCTGSDAAIAFSKTVENYYNEAYTYKYTFSYDENLYLLSYERTK